MLSKNKIKFIRSLESKKERNNLGLFVAEGEKLVDEILASTLETTYIAGTYDWFSKHNTSKVKGVTDSDIVLQEELNKVSTLKTPHEVLCIAKIPNYSLSVKLLNNKLSIILDTIQDPGNMGTIIRIADWFGIEDIICSIETVDAFNPKVVQSSMGAICRVKVHYANLPEVISEINALSIPMYGTTLNGENIYNAALSANGFIMMGNESKGLSPRWLPLLDKQLFIPFFPENKKSSESLNVAVATGIICSEFRRRW